MNPLKNTTSRPLQTRRVDGIDHLHGRDIPDPYRWLEDVDSTEVAEWIESQNRHTQSLLRAVPFGRRLRDRIEHLSSVESVGMPVEAGQRVFFTLRTPEALQPSLVWIEQGGREIHRLVDPAALAEDAAISISGFNPSPTGRYVAYGLSEAGSDWQTWYVMDVDSGERLSDALHWIRFTYASWLEDESGFFYTGSEPPPPRQVYKAPATPRTIRFHRIGEAQSADRVIYGQRDPADWLTFGRVTSDNRHLVLTTQKGTYRQHRIHVLDLHNLDQDPRVVIPEFGASFTFLGSENERLFFWTDDGAPLGRIVGIDVGAPERETWREIVAESDGAIEAATYVQGNFVVSVLVNAESHFRVFDASGKAVREVPLPGRGTVSLIDGRAQGPRVYLWYSDVARPTLTIQHNVLSGETRPFRPQSLPYDPDDFVTERFDYESTDGTRVPIFISRKRSTQVGVDTPTCLYGYGGFNISQSPSFRLDHLAWMDMGGQLAVACIRGGGEYGKSWHMAGACKNRPNVFADFIAAAEWLIASKRTSTPKLVIHGRSNGGLLVGACMTMRPDLYGACLPAVGVLDMLRFHKFTVGAFWVSDYGSPDDPEMFPVLLSYSPLHNVQQGAAYPPTLVTTADHDDRVFPAHSFKFAAALQAAQSGEAPILLRVDARAGHGIGKPKDKLLDEIADNWIFTFAALDVTPELP
jgi:prolyl oligopeptidase